MSDASLPPPPVAPDVDLAGYGFMPLHGHRLFGSDFNARCTDAEWRAGVTLWWASWNQVPAASLPDDDIALCRLAQLGRDVKAWRKLRANALRGFVLCSDGRLYHPVLAKLAIDAWDRRVSDRERKKRWRERTNLSSDGPADADADTPRNADVRVEAKRSERDREIERGGEPPAAAGAAPPPKAGAAAPSPSANGVAPGLGGPAQRAAAAASSDAEKIEKLRIILREFAMPADPKAAGEWYGFLKRHHLASNFGEARSLIAHCAKDPSVQYHRHVTTAMLDAWRAQAVP